MKNNAEYKFLFAGANTVDNGVTSQCRFTPRGGEPSFVSKLLHSCGDWDNNTLETAGPEGVGTPGLIRSEARG